LRPIAEVEHKRVIPSAIAHRQQPLRCLTALMRGQVDTAPHFSDRRKN
jgi:hypothetical protein